MKAGPSYLECQDCGQNLRELSLAEKQMVALNPYNYITYCKSCSKEAIEASIKEFG